VPLIVSHCYPTLPSHRSLPHQQHAGIVLEERADIKHLRGGYWTLVRLVAGMRLHRTYAFRGAGENNQDIKYGTRSLLCLRLSAGDLPHLPSARASPYSPARRPPSGGSKQDIIFKKQACQPADHLHLCFNPLPASTVTGQLTQLMTDLST
jgi:hypothetical protein